MFASRRARRSRSAPRTAGPAGPLGPEHRLAAVSHGIDAREQDHGQEDHPDRDRVGPRGAPGLRRLALAIVVEERIGRSFMASSAGRRGTARPHRGAAPCCPAPRRRRPPQTADGGAQPPPRRGRAPASPPRAGTRSPHGDRSRPGSPDRRPGPSPHGEAPGAGHARGRAARDVADGECRGSPRTGPPRRRRRPGRRPSSPCRPAIRIAGPAQTATTIAPSAAVEEVDVDRQQVQDQERPSHRKAERDRHGQQRPPRPSGRTSSGDQQQGRQRHHPHAGPTSSSPSAAATTGPASSASTPAGGSSSSPQPSITAALRGRHCRHAEGDVRRAPVGVITFWEK